jgi:hypothetical protein
MDDLRDAIERDQLASAAALLRNGTAPGSLAA